MRSHCEPIPQQRLEENAHILQFAGGLRDDVVTFVGRPGGKADDPAKVERVVRDADEVARPRRSDNEPVWSPALSADRSGVGRRIPPDRRLIGRNVWPRRLCSLVCVKGSEGNDGGEPDGK